jgi:ribonuclease J
MSNTSEASPLRVISLGGVGTMGKNMTLFEQRGELLIVDCGLMFPGTDHPGVDLIIPDMTYVLDNAERVAGVVLTHGHEDHIGGLPYLLEQMPALVWGTSLTLGLLENRLAEFDPVPGTELIGVNAGDRVTIGSFDVEFVRVNHSVRDGVGVGIHTDQGLVVHTGDFKFDQTPVDGISPDFQALGRFGSEEPLLLLSDCTNVERPGFAGSERDVGERLGRIFSEAEGRLIVTCFASHISRMEAVFQQSARCGRKVAVAGRSMVRNIQTAQRLGAMELPPGVEIPLEQVADLAPHEVTILASGSQGEPYSAMTRMTVGGHKWIEIGEGDTVVFSASFIPGNESMILRNVDNLYRRGARVVYGPEEGVHVSGHGNRDELRLMLNLTRPRFVAPVHGDYRHLMLYRDLAMEMGWPAERVLLLEMGHVLEFDNGQMVRAGEVAAGGLNVDGLGVGDVGEVVLTDRQALSEDGIVLPALALRKDTWELIGGPEIYSRGFVFMSESEEIVAELRDEARATYERLADEGPVDPERLYDRLRSAVGKRIGVLTGRRPMVLPVIIPVDLEAQPAAEDELEGVVGADEA